MKSNLFFRVIIFLFCAVYSMPVQADKLMENEAKQWVEEKGKELLIAFGEPDISVKYSKLDEMLVSVVDLKYVSKFVIGKYWRNMSSEQRISYQDLFTRYALSIYKSFPLDFNAEQIKFDIVSVMTEDKKTTVKIKLDISSLLQTNDKTLSDIYVDFILRKDNKGIKIIDLKLGESSLILSYRSRFYEMIAQNDDDIDWFLTDLGDITEAAERTIQENLLQTEY